VDWNSDGNCDLITGERHGYLHVFIREDTGLTASWQYRLLDSTVLDVGMNSQPAVADWNGDGMKDLLLGEEGGSIRFYANMTSDTWPMFQDFTLVEAEGAPILHFRVNPYVVDLDQDGQQDLVCGSECGLVLFHRNVGTNADPRLARAETLKTTAGTPIAPCFPTTLSSRCGFGDWNNDGLEDFLISGNGGRVELYLGTAHVGAREETHPVVSQPRVAGTVTAGLLNLPLAPNDGQAGPIRLLDAGGRNVLDLHPGVNDVSRCCPGVYFVSGGGLSRKVVLTR
jgi:hypothetical protein